MLFHLTTRAAWAAALVTGRYTTEGPFSHLSLERQWRGVRERFFRDATDLLLLVIDPARLRAEVRFEPADGDVFPHLYGPLGLDAVVDTISV